MVIDVQLRLIVWESLPFSGDCLCLSENDHPDKHCDQIVENGSQKSFQSTGRGLLKLGMVQTLLMSLVHQLEPELIVSDIETTLQHHLMPNFRKNIPLTSVEEEEDVRTTGVDSDPVITEIRLSLDNVTGRTSMKRFNKFPPPHFIHVPSHQNINRFCEIGS